MTWTGVKKAVEVLWLMFWGFMFSMHVLGFGLHIFDLVVSEWTAENSAWLAISGFAWVEASRDFR